MPKNHIGQHARNWKAWRERRLMTQRQLAFALGITERSVQYIESGKVKPRSTTQARFRDLQERHKRGPRGS